MYDDLHNLYVEWRGQTGKSSLIDFSSDVFRTTGVMLSDVLTDEERNQFLTSFDGDEGLLEGLDSGP